MNRDASNEPLADGELPYKFKNDFADIHEPLKIRKVSLPSPNYAYNAGLDHFGKELEPFELESDIEFHKSRRFVGNKNIE